MGGMLDFISGAANAGAEIVGNRIAQAQKVDSEIDLQSRLTPIMAEREKAVGEERNRLALALNQGKIDQDIANAPKKAEAEAATKRTVGAAENDVAIARERDMAPVKLKNEIAEKDAALDFQTAHLKQLVGNERALAQARHIVDPSYQMISNQDGTVSLFNTRNPKAGAITLTGSDGKPVIQKNLQEMQSAKEMLSAASSELRIAETAYQSAIKNDPTDAVAKKTWDEAQARYKKIAEPALSILGVKAGVKSDGESSPKKTGWDSSTGEVFKNGSVIGNAKTEAEARALAAGSTSSTDKPAAKPTGGGMINTPQKTYNDAGYESIDSTIEGAAQGNAAAKMELRRMLDEGGLTAQQRAKAAKALGN